MRVVAGYVQIPDKVQHKKSGRYDKFLIEAENTLRKQRLRCLEIEPDKDLSVKGQACSLRKAIKRLGLEIGVTSTKDKIYITL